MLEQFKKYWRESQKYKEHTSLSESLPYFLRWRKTMGTGKNSIEIGLPWFSFHAIDFISKNIPENSRVFEFGGGGSTTFFLMSKFEVTTVEHDPQWYNMLVENFSQNPKWNGIHCPAVQFDETLLSRDFSIPEHFSSSDEMFLNHSFENYATSINQFPNEYFDLILVDGRSRPSCIECSINHLKKGGFLIVDNTERSYYLDEFNKRHREKFECMSDKYGPVPYVDWFNKTAIFKKKK